MKNVVKENILLLCFFGFFSFVKSQTLETSNLTVYPIENGAEIVTCTLENNTPNNYNVSWVFFESLEPVPTKGSPDFQWSVTNEWNNVTIAYLNVTGEVLVEPPQELDHLRKQFYCDSRNIVTGDILNRIPLLVEVNVPLTLTPTQVPEEYVCLDERVDLRCEFRSYLAPRSVNWKDTYNGVISESRPQTYSSLVLWTTRLEISNANSSITSTCMGNRSAAGFNPYIELANHTFNIPLRDDQISRVEASNVGDNVCSIRWFGTVSSYVTGFQVSYSSNETAEVSVDLVASPWWEYRWKMSEGADPTDIKVSLIMGRCMGPPQNATGTCYYVQETETPYKTILIGVGAGLGLVVLILLGCILWMYYSKRKPEKKYTEKPTIALVPQNDPENNTAGRRANAPTSIIHPYASSAPERNTASRPVGVQEAPLYVEVDNHPPHQATNYLRNRNRQPNPATNEHFIYDDTEAEQPNFYDDTAGESSPTAYIQPMNTPRLAPKSKNVRQDVTDHSSRRNNPRLPPIGGPITPKVPSRYPLVQTKPTTRYANIKANEAETNVKTLY